MSTFRVNPTTSVGFLVGIGAWSISFITLIWAYVFYRLRTEAWLGGYITESVSYQALVNTLMLILSSWAFHKFLQDKKRVFFLAGNLLGILFIFGQIDLWSIFLSQGLSFKGSLAGNFFYLLTGFHAIHIIIGIIVLIVVGSKQCFLGECPFFNARFELALKFWDLLLIFWAVLLVLIFLLK